MSSTVSENIENNEKPYKIVLEDSVIISNKRKKEIKKPRKCQRQCAFVQHSQPLQQQTRLIHRLGLDSDDIFIVTFIIILFMLQMIL